MSIESTKKVMQKYLEAEHGDVSMMAPKVVFTTMSTGEEAKTPEGVLGMLNYFYHVAFDAQAETRNMIVGDGHAVLEGIFTGKHIGEFAGIPATHKEVRVPLCVVYDLENDLIQAGRVYLEMPVMMQQLGVSA
jgi:predicted ester cyclase